jgi:hypothetical protein
MTANIVIAPNEKLFRVRDYRVRIGAPARRGCPLLEQGSRLWGITYERENPEGVGLPPLWYCWAYTFELSAYIIRRRMIDEMWQHDPQVIAFNFHNDRTKTKHSWVHWSDIK